MPTLNLNGIDKLYYGNTEAQKLYKGSQKLYPVEIVDPYLANVVLHLKGDGENNSTSIVDSSPTPKTITRVGNTKISTAQSKYGGSSILFDGNGDYLNLDTISTTPVYGLFNKDYTIEAWIYTTTTTPQMIIGNLDDSNGQGSWWLILNSTFQGLHQIQFFTRSGLQFRVNNSINFPTNQWTHLAISKSGLSAKVFINGVLQTTLNLSGMVAGEITKPFLIGMSWHQVNGFVSYPFTGYLDSLRLTEGVARYTTNFNPETDTYLAY